MSRDITTRRRMATEPALRAMPDAGAQAARSGQVIADHHAAITAGAQRSARRSAQRQERQRSLQQRGRRGNAVSRAQNSKRLRQRTIALGFADVSGYLGERPARGWSISRIAAELRCARETASALLAEVGASGPLDPAHPVDGHGTPTVTVPVHHQVDAMNEQFAAYPPALGETLVAGLRDARLCVEGARKAFSRGGHPSSMARSAPHSGGGPRRCSRRPDRRAAIPAGATAAHTT